MLNDSLYRLHQEKRSLTTSNEELQANKKHKNESHPKLSVSKIPSMPKLVFTHPENPPSNRPGEPEIPYEELCFLASCEGGRRLKELMFPVL